MSLAFVTTSLAFVTAGLPEPPRALRGGYGARDTHYPLMGQDVPPYGTVTPQASLWLTARGPSPRPTWDSSKGSIYGAGGLSAPCATPAV